MQRPSRQELGIDVPGLPKLQSQLVVGLDLLRQLSDVAHWNAELMFARTVFGVMRTHLLVFERFELLHYFSESHMPETRLSGAATATARRRSMQLCSAL